MHCIRMQSVLQVYDCLCFSSFSLKIFVGIRMIGGAIGNANGWDHFNTFDSLFLLTYAAKSVSFYLALL